MAVPLDKFVQHLADSGVLAEETLQEFLPPNSHPKDAQELAKELVRKKKLTRFQAEEAYKGKAASLVLGNYVLIERIGAGGMGQVFRARHRRMNRLVAVKLLPSAMTKDKAAIARFEREVRAAAKIIHPNIVAAYDADQANGAHFLVMELVEGSDLSALVKKQGAISHDKAVGYIVQAAKGLEAAHAAGIVHRDIKPANLLLDTSGMVKILDMGLARLGNDDGVSQAELTSTGMVMGTIDYMSPEQAMNTKSADARADIYALGCSLYFLLTGRAAYDGDSLMAKLIAHREFPIPSLRDVCPDAPEQLDAVFQKMIAKTTEDRFQSMTEVIAALEQCRSPGAADGELSSGDGQLSSTSKSNESLSNFLQGVTVVTHPPGPAKRGPAKQAPRTTLGNDRKKILLMVGAGLGAILIVVVLVGVVISMQKKPGTRTVAEKRSKKENTPKLAPGEPKPGKVVSSPSVPSARTPPAGPASPAGLPSPGGSALEFNGQGSRVEIPTLSRDEAGPLTIEAYVTLAAASGNIVVRMEGTAACQLYGWPSPSNPSAEWVPNAADHRGKFQQGTPAMVLNRRYHLALQFDKDSAQLYIDGKLANSQDRAPAPAAGTLRGTTIGAHADGSAAIVGTLDEIRISSVRRYRQDFQPKGPLASDADTLALYHCDEGQGDMLKDSSGKGHHGKIVGAKWVNVRAGDDPDRAAVAGVLAIGRAVDVFADGKPLSNLASAADLPPGPIEVRQVNVNRCPEATDENLACLRGCRHLRVVQLTNCPATDKSLAYLSESKGLRTLILYASGVTDAGLPLLEGFKELEYLNVKQLPVTEPALKKLAAALPRCRIEWNQGTFGPASPDKR